MTLTPEQRPTLTISESGVVLTETYDGNEVPAEYSFSIVNDYVHAHGRHFEELQYLALGMASHIDAQQEEISSLNSRIAKPVPLDVLMTFGVEIADKAHDAGVIGNLFTDEDIAAIADRYASQVQQNELPVRYYKEGGITYAVYGSSSINYVEKLRTMLSAAKKGE